MLTFVRGDKGSWTEFSGEVHNLLVGVVSRVDQGDPVERIGEQAWH